MKNLPLCRCDHNHPDKVLHTKREMLDDNLIYDLSDFYKVLGDSTRIKILWALDLNELCVCDLAAALGMTKSAISHQLKSLKEANLVKYRKDGKNAFYSIADEHVKQIIETGLEHIRE